jgi:hypothetical protein
MPLQGMVTMDNTMRSHRDAEKAQPVAYNPVGQVVGQMKEVQSVRELMRTLIEDYVEATERLQRLNAV